jgi:hypothetical protein
MYSSSTSIVCKELESESRNGYCYKPVNSIHASALNHSEFVAFLEEVGNQYGEIIDHTNVRWLSRGSFLEEVENQYGETTDHTNVRWLSQGSVLTRFFFTCCMRSNYSWKRRAEILKN